MPQLGSAQGIIRFDDFEADPRSGELRKHGIPIKLQGQPFQVLQILLEHPGEVVTREELQKRIWPADTFVDFDQGLNNAVKKLREALRDDAEKPRFIETLPKRGYRFIGLVQNAAPAAPPKELTAAATATTGRAPETHREVFAWGIVLGTAVAAALVLVLGLNPGGMRDRLLGKIAAPRIQSLAVLPLQNLSNDPAQEYLSDGMTDSLITDLAQIGTMKVISHTSTTRYKKTDRALPEIARELDVDGIIEGTVQRFGDRVRINIQLIHGPSDRHLWAKSYERDLRDIFALERDVTGDITHQVQARLTTPEHGPPTQPRPVDPKVLEAYLQGNYHLSRYGEGFGGEELKKAAESFQQAIDADPNFAPAYNGLSSAHQQLVRGSSEDAAIARRAAEKAVELDPHYSDAHVSLGFIEWQPYLDWRGAEEELKKAIALNPNSAMARYTLSGLLMALGRADEALRECKIAQQLDPNADNSGDCLYHARDYDGAIAIHRLMLQRDPKNGLQHCGLFNPYFKKGMEKEAIDELAECYSLFGFSEIAAHMRHALAVSGSRGAIREWAKGLEHLQATHQVYVPGNLATAYTILGDKDRAFYWLEQAYQHREMVSIDGGVYWLRPEPMYDPLRSDPRYKDLLRRIGPPP